MLSLQPESGPLSSKKFPYLLRAVSQEAVRDSIARIWTMALGVTLICAPTSLALAWQETASPKIEPVKLERVPPKTLEEVAQSIETLPEFEVELVAAEPLVQDPVAFAFDARGRLLVIEMLDYSEQDKESLGRLRRLEDTDHDGRMDRVETILDHLSWPTALALVNEGALVAAAPDLYWIDIAKRLEDAQVKPETWATGFGRSNVQGLINSFRWGLDQRWHATTSSNGGDIKGLLTLDSLSVRLQDIAIDTRTRKLGTVPGGGQHGMDFNAFGDKFVSSNSDHYQQVIAWQYPDWTSQVLSKPLTLRRSMALDGPQAEVYRASPVEAWRTWRTELRVSGKVPGIVEGGGRAAGYFTGATGVVIYDGDQWGELEFPTAFVADVGGNLIHRKKMMRRGLWWYGDRVDDKKEFLRSSDIWFRPVQMGDGPDGCLYIADMAREVIEHPASLPPMIKGQLDLTSGRDKGRIWRVKAKGRPIRREPPNLDQLSSVELAAITGHANGWHRETAARLLYERNDPAAIEALRDVALKGVLPEGRVQAIASLGSYEKGLNETVIVAALNDVSPRVHQQVLWQMGRNKISSFGNVALSHEVSRIAKEGSLESQFWLALYLGQLATYQPELRKDMRYQELVTALVVTQLNQDRRIELANWSEYVLAVEWCLGENALSMFEQVMNRKVDESDVLQPWIESLLFGALKHKPTSEVLESFSAVWTKCSQSDEHEQVILAKWLIEALERKFAPATTWCRAEADEAMQAWLKNRLLPQVDKAIEDSRGVLARDLLGWELLNRLPAAERLTLLHRALGDNVSSIVQVAAIKTMVANDVAHFDFLLDALGEMAPEVYTVALESMAGRELGAGKLIDAVERTQVAAGTLPPEIWLTLERLPNEGLAARAKKLHASLFPTVAWEEVAGGYRKAWEETPNVENGRVVFRKLCSSCHRIEEEGVHIGPPLASVIEKSNEQLALSVFQPNAEVDPRYQMYQIVTDDGVVHTGLMESSQGDVVVLRNAKGELERFQRSEIEVLKASGKSLMPEGLLSQMKPDEFRDVLAFIRQYAGRNQSPTKEK
ncbi:MAG: c-type cytochrome [Planctomycetes bacterium]|nr:c-type cytochrome [Planctomycetota bacterium]